MKKIITILLRILIFTKKFTVEKFTNTQKSQSKEITLIPDVNSDDSAYDDPSTLEFCLNNGKGINLCIYHNIRKQKGINFEDYEVYAEWNLTNKIMRWVKQNLDGLSVIWDYRNGAILKMETESSKWATKRGIKVGDPISKAYDAYVADATLYRWDPKAKKSVKISENPNCLYMLKQADEGILVYVANLIDEEVMNIRFTQKDGIITKIEIFFDN